MKSVLIYLMQVVIASGVLYGYYHFFLRNRRFHQYNRYYLLTATVISVLIPFLQIPVYLSDKETESSIVLKTLKTIYYSGSEEEVVITGTINNSQPFDWNKLLYILYALIAIVLFIRILISLRKINSLIKANAAEELDGIHFVNTNEQAAPFSFFRWLFWNRQIELKSAKGQQIFRHEVFHIRQKHSWDILFMEITNMIFWINPFFHIIKKELLAIHEFLADQFAVKEEDKWSYAELLLMQALQTKHHLVNPFFHNQIKRRIAMITNPQKTSHRYWRKLMVLPLTILVITLVAFNYKNKIVNVEKALEDPVAEAMIDEKKSGAPQEITVTGTYHDSTIVSAEIGSSFAGGEKAWAEFLKKNLNTDIPVKKKAPNGTYTVIVKFMINQDGSAGEMKALTHHGYGMEEEALRVVRKVQSWIPATQNGHKVSAYKAAPIIFVIANNEKTATAERSSPDEITVIGYPKQRTDIEKIETEPSFPGGSKEWIRFLERNLNPNAPVEKDAPAGNYTVVLQFMVKKDGSIADVKALTQHGYGMEEEAIRVIQQQPKWNPAIQNGRAVNAYKKQLITFVVASDEQPPATNGSSLNEVVAVGYKSEAKSTPHNRKDSLTEVVVMGYKSQQPTAEQQKKPAQKEMIPETDVNHLTPIYPNPANNTITVPYSTQAEGTAEISVRDMSGKAHITQKTSLVKGLNTLTINVASLVKGTYIITVTDSKQQSARVYKMVKQ